MPVAALMASGPVERNPAVIAATSRMIGVVTRLILRVRMRSGGSGGAEPHSGQVVVRASLS